MGGGTPRVWSTAGQVDPLTGLVALDGLRACLWEALADGGRLPLTVVVAEVSDRAPFEHPLELARRVMLAGAMAHGAFASALAVGRLGSRRVGVLSGRDADLPVRTALLGRMVADLPATVVVHPVAGSPEVADWLVRQLAA